MRDCEGWWWGRRGKERSELKEKYGSEDERKRMLCDLCLRPVFGLFLLLLLLFGC